MRESHRGRNLKGDRFRERERQRGRERDRVGERGRVLKTSRYST
jgi:hypothetical protein